MSQAIRGMPKSKIKLMENKLIGQIVKIFDKQQVTETFTKREFVIQTNEQYPQMVKFELTQAKCADIDSYSIGDSLIVHFNVRGRKWTNKEGKDSYFISLQAWRLEGDAASSTNTQSIEQAKEDPATLTDDLPF